MTEQNDPKESATRARPGDRNDPIPLDTGTATPTDPPTGLPFFYNSARNELWIWDGSKWIGFAQVYS
jgi:hypothetical protein